MSVRARMIVRFYGHWMPAINSIHPIPGSQIAEFTPWDTKQHQSRQTCPSAGSIPAPSIIEVHVADELVELLTPDLDILAVVDGALHEYRTRAVGKGLLESRDELVRRLDT